MVKKIKDENLGEETETPKSTKADKNSVTVTWLENNIPMSRVYSLESCGEDYEVRAKMLADKKGGEVK